MKLSELLGDPSWLFDLSFPVACVNDTKSFAKPERLEWELDDSFRIPPLSSLADEKRFAEFSIGWNDDGLFLPGSIRQSQPDGPRRGDPTIHLPSSTPLWISRPISRGRHALLAAE